jgi:solute carrier family 9 (sodium/hydrogen exchanger), member 8
MMILSPWVCYLVADGLKMSGIVAIMTNGIFLNMYAAPNLSRGSRRVLKITYETIAYSAETLVFVFLGIGVFAFDHPMKQIGIGAIVLAIINLNIARFLNILIVSKLVNWARSEKTKISRKQQFVMWISGLRGAMAYALSLQSIQDYGAPGKIMLVITIIYALLTILGVGSILNPILEKCDVLAKPQNNERDQENNFGEQTRCCARFKNWIV